MDENAQQLALKGIEEIRNQYSGKKGTLDQANEAATRLKIIDRVLRLLGWDDEEIHPEYSAGGAGFVDYLLFIENTPQIIVEAKRAGYTFGFSSRNLANTEYTVSYLLSAFPGGIRDVIDQAKRYSLETEVPYALITNGMDWVFMRVSHIVGGQSTESLKAFYFGNILEETFVFDLFWNLLNRDSVAEGHYIERFSELLVEPSPVCLSPRNQHGELKWRTPDSISDISEFYALFFDQIIDLDHRLMLKHCFVSDPKLDHLEGRLKRALRDIKPSYFPSDAIEIAPNEREPFLNNTIGGSTGRVIIVAGSVGCGKSTFIYRIIQASKEDKKRRKKDLYVSVDLINDINDEHVDVNSLLWKYIYRQWRDLEPQTVNDHDTLTKILQPELARLRSTHHQLYEKDKRAYEAKEAETLDRLVQDHETFFHHCWHYYQQRHKRIVVFIDNVDRAEESFQKKVYAFAHKLAKNTGATVIITMREVTFFRVMSV